MVADIVGYSRMIEADEAGTIAAIKKLRSDIIDPLLTEAHGRIVKLMGDGLIVEFGSVVDAVSAAVDMQNALAARQATSSPDRRIVFRIGINLGDVVVDGDDLIGDGVNVAARLEQICEPGGVLVSGTGFDQLQGKLAVPIGFVGEQRVKNIQRPIRIYRVGPGGSRMSWVRRISRRRRLRTATAVAVALAIALALAGAGLWLFGTGGSRLMANASIAVLPFENLGGDEATLRLANGLTEDIITDLARYRNVDVIARNSTAVYQGKPVDVRQVGQDLNVSYVLEGSVQRDEDRIRITAQLIDARTAGHLWSQRWDRMFADFFAVQAEISEQVAAQVVGWQGAISLAEHQTHRRTQPQDMTVYDTYLRGDEALSRFTKESVEESIPLFESVVKEAPQFAQGWTALGSAYEAMVDFGADSQIALPNALDAVRHAIELDPMDADAHALLGQLLGMQGDFKRSEAEFDIALGLNPGSADVMSAYIT
ncbi:MAG: adenylate/guanylate cyclase domain-containing protein, partial [Hypericibacter sp.]